MVHRRLLASLALSVAAPLLAVVPTAAAEAGPTGVAATPTMVAAAGPLDDTRELPPGQVFSVEDGPAVQLGAYPGPETLQADPPMAAVESASPPPGTVRQWLGLDQVGGRYYRKDYTLRGIGDHIEVWVADDLAFPVGDCRDRVTAAAVVTDEQVASFVQEFDTNIYPTETAAFSTPPDRDGTHALLGPDAGGNGGDFTGAGDKTVTLVDNVRDANFYDLPNAPTYVAGFFSRQLAEWTDRNVMTVDAFDWLHRTGAEPADEPTADPCTSRPGRPHLYEGVFAHEWQHLLQYYIDPLESIWLNEGLSDFAQTVTGYVDANATVFQRGTDTHLACFQGFGTVQTVFNPHPRDCGGPENSLNLWDEGNNASGVLADYGNAYQFLLFLYDRYGTSVISTLHRDSAQQGLTSVATALGARGIANVFDVLHDYQMMTYLDGIIDGARCLEVSGFRRADATSASVTSTINLANPAINATPGVAPNGADYVPLTGVAPGGAVVALRGRELTSLVFDGAAALPPLAQDWRIVTDDPDRPGDPVLFSGNADGLDAVAIIPVTVPVAQPELTFLAKYGAEAGYDFGYVSVSTDGGASYVPVAGDRTVTGPNGPALTGSTAGFEAHHFDLSAYAGQQILLSFRYVSDAGVNAGGLLLDDITLGGALLSDGSTLTPFLSPTAIRPTPVSNWAIRIIGISESADRTMITVLAPTVGTRLTMDTRALRKLDRSDRVLVMVSYDEPTGRHGQYAPYTLTVNGTVQAGGSPST